MNPQRSDHGWRRTRWVGMLTLATVCGTGGCAADPAAQEATPTTTVTAAATPPPSASPAATSRLLTTEGEGVTREDYLYLLVALGSNDAVEETAARSAQAARDAVAALEASLLGRYHLTIDDGGVVALPLSEDELRTFEESVDDQARQDGARGLELYVTKLGHALDTVGPHVLERYDGVVATVMLDMPNAGLWLSPAGATDGIYLAGTSYAQATRSIDVMTENITVVDRASKQESTRVLAHEIGHRLGLGHAGTTQCQQDSATPWDGTLPVRIAGRDCWGEEYGDTTNIMGRGEAGKAAPEGELFNALQLHQLRILPADQIIDIPSTMAAGTVLEYELHTLTS